MIWLSSSWSKDFCWDCSNSVFIEESFDDCWSKLGVPYLKELFSLLNLLNLATLSEI